MNKTRELMYEFELERSYIEDKSFLMYKKVRDKYDSILPRLTVTTYNGKKRTKPFTLIYGAEKLSVHMDFQGHVRQADNMSLYNWFEKHKPRKGDIIRWYKTDTDNEFIIELVRSDDYAPQQTAEISEETQSKPTNEHKLKNINKFFELKEKGILTQNEYNSCKDKLLSEIKVSLDNIESFHDLFKKNIISEGDFNKKKGELISSEGL